jgi:hypothetical protein
MQRVSTEKLQEIHSPVSELLNQISGLEAELENLIKRNQDVQQTKVELFGQTIHLLSRNKQVLAGVTNVNAGVDESLYGFETLHRAFVGKP